MEITDKAVVVYAKKEGKLCFFNIYDYETQEAEAKEKFVELMDDISLGEYRMMTIEHFSDILEEGSRVLS